MNKRLLIAVSILIILIAGYFMIHRKRVDLVVIDPDTHAPVEQAVTLGDGRQCYVYSHDATADEPYATTDFMDITIAGTSVTGIRRGTQDGPDMTNGYGGTMEGTLSSNTITDVFSYTIEGSKNKEQEIFRVGPTGIEKLRYQLMEGKGMLVPDTTKPYAIQKYARVGCQSSD